MITAPLSYGQYPWKWDVPSVYQCTWYVYFRCFLQFGSYPCWWDRATQTGSYANAKDWIANYRDPWVVKGLDYVPKAGDVVVYDGEYGHVQFMETDVMYSEYSSGNPDSFRLGKLEDYKGKIIGYLHYPYEPVPTVERNANVNQIRTLDDSLRIRVAPSLAAEVTGFVQLGYYNVISVKKADGYEWYQIAKDRWCANVETEYLPKGESDDFVEQIRKWADGLIAKVKENEDTVKSMKDDYRKIEEITKRWV